MSCKKRLNGAFHKCLTCYSFHVCEECLATRKYL
jgi:hypothetical protein